MMKLQSVCGDSYTMIEYSDYDLNPHGSICCSNCRSIIQARESWALAYNYTF